MPGRVQVPSCKRFSEERVVIVSQVCLQVAENVHGHQNSAKADELNLHGNSTAADGFAEECNCWQMLRFFI